MEDRSILGKMKQLKFKIFKKEIFFIITLLLLVLISFVVVYNFLFLIKSFDKSFNNNNKNPSGQGFDIEGFEQLKLTK